MAACSDGLWLEIDESWDVSMWQRTNTHRLTHTCTHAHMLAAKQTYNIVWALIFPWYPTVILSCGMESNQLENAPTMPSTLSHSLSLSHSHACCLLHSPLSLPLSRWVSASEVRSGAAKPEKMLPTKKVELAHVFNDCQRKLLSEHCAAALCEVAGSSSRAKQARKLQSGELYNKIPYAQFLKTITNTLRVSTDNIFCRQLYFQ